MAIGCYEEMDKYNYTLDYEELELLICEFLEEMYGLYAANFWWQRVEVDGQRKWRLEYYEEFDFNCTFTEKRECLDAFYENIVERYFQERIQELWDEEIADRNRDYEIAVLGYGKF